MHGYKKKYELERTRSNAVQIQYRRMGTEFVGNAARLAKMFVAAMSELDKEDSDGNWSQCTDWNLKGLYLTSFDLTNTQLY